MINLPCPQCGGDVPVRSAALPYATCPYCRTVILRDSEELRAVGTAAVLPFDVSPIQLGTRGVAQGQGFEVVGRVRWGWSHGSWNEWLLACGDGKTRWLGEAMGSYAVLGERPDLLTEPNVAAFAKTGLFGLGDTVMVNGRTLVATDIKTATCLGSEGDLPFPTPPDWKMTNVDFRSSDGTALSLQRDRDGTSAWAGLYCDLAALSPSNLRRIDGWALPAAVS
jgi:hypothetical protein